ncbi:MAG: RNA-binding S4 domain-containing protein [Armatimonadetes bacterium]|nr:RNA-binding S4 domain-containing protein [Armatimonadota bacterium]
MSTQKPFQLRGEYITLGQLLKAIGAVDRGSDVKELLYDFEFFVNGEPENRRGRKLRAGDVVSTPDGEFKIE